MTRRELLAGTVGLAGASVLHVPYGPILPLAPFKPIIPAIRIVGDKRYALQRAKMLGEGGSIFVYHQIGPNFSPAQWKHCFDLFYEINAPPVKGFT